MLVIDGQPGVCVVDIDPPLKPGEIEIDLRDTPESVALEDLLSRWSGGGMSCIAPRPGHRVGPEGPR
jgi:hypothetical protein